MLTLEGVETPATRGRLGRAVSFLRPYFFALGSAIGLFSVGWATWRGRALIVEFCRLAGYRYGARAPESLPQIAPERLVPDGSAVRLAALEGVDGNVSERELAIIGQLVSRTHPAQIFEIGTFDGRTTLNIAINSPDSRIDTLDLPASDSSRVEAPLDRHEIKYAQKPRSGARYAGTEAEGRICQLSGDSATFDFSPWYGKVDLIFIDGSHAYPYVINDSLQAIRMLREERGVVIWHDYGQWDGVTLALNDLKRSHPAFRDLVRLRGTTLAVLQTGPSAPESPQQVPAAAFQLHG